MHRQDLEYPKLPPAVAGRYPTRVIHSLKTIHTIINTAPLIHISYQARDTPFNTIIPMIGRLGSFARPSADESEVLDLYLHVHAKHALAETVTRVDGVPVSAVATHVDGLVLSMTPFSHSVNFRSAVVFGVARLVEDAEEKLWAMRLITNGVVPGRWENTRTPPTKAELTSTAVLRVQITGGSAKIRQGPPGEERFDVENLETVASVWTGVVPMHTVMGEPIPGPQCGVECLPHYIAKWRVEANNDREKACLDAAKKLQ